MFPQDNPRWSGFKVGICKAEKMMNTYISDPGCPCLGEATWGIPPKAPVI